MSKWLNSENARSSGRNGSSALGCFWPPKTDRCTDGQVSVYLLNCRTVMERQGIHTGILLMLVTDAVVDGLERFQHLALRSPDVQWTYPKLTGLIPDLRSFLGKLRGKLHPLRFGYLGEHDVPDVEDTIGLV